MNMRDILLVLNGLILMKMKKLFPILWTILFLSVAVAGDFNDKGLISGWGFAPLQVDAGLIESRKLVDESSNTFLALGLILVQQKSSILSLALVATHLQNNYGLQLNPFPMGTATDNNYGISVGFENYTKRCYGVQIGILNHIWAGGIIEKHTELMQFCGINIADSVFIGILNDTDKVQIGLLNNGRYGAAFQIGLLNYNPKSYLPWMPLINFDMGRKFPVVKYSENPQ